MGARPLADAARAQPREARPPLRGRVGFVAGLDPAGTDAGATDYPAAERPDTAASRNVSLW